MSSDFEHIEEINCWESDNETEQSYAKGSQKQTWWQRVYLRFKK